MEYNVVFMVKYDEIAKNNIAPIFQSYEWWIELVSKVLKNTDEFEMRLWKDDVEGIQSGQRFGKQIPNNNTMEIVFKGKLTPELEQEILTNYLTKEGHIVLDYHRLTKIKLKEVPEGATWEFVTWDYTEQLIIDREKETLEHIQNIGTGCKISRKYEIEGGIESLLDDFDAEDLFGNIVGNPDDAVENPNETKHYKITIDYKKNPQRVIEGSYDKNGLPEDFTDFADTVFDFIRFYGLGEILDPSVYGKVKRRQSDYIFCSVTFDEGYKSYYYLTDDDSIEVGDFVIVSAGKDDHETVVKVANIEYFDEENAPLPIDKTKRIIRKCADEDFDLQD